MTPGWILKIRKLPELDRREALRGLSFRKKCAYLDHLAERQAALGSWVERHREQLAEWAAQDKFRRAASTRAAKEGAAFGLRLIETDRHELPAIKPSSVDPGGSQTPS